jgi:hypothetical protein
MQQDELAVALHFGVKSSITTDTGVVRKSFAALCTTPGPYVHNSSTIKKIKIRNSSRLVDR